VPVAQRLAPLGFVVAVPLATPQDPFRGAAHETSVPVPDPKHDHDHEPSVFTATVVSVPVAQRLAVGIVVTPTPAADPQVPLIEGEGATQIGLSAPPFIPKHDHDHEPSGFEATVVAFPVAQRLAVGVKTELTPAAIPQDPSTKGAEQEAVNPPPAPTQVHDH